MTDDPTPTFPPEVTAEPPPVTELPDDTRDGDIGEAEPEEPE